MFKQRRKDRTRAGSCYALRHVFPKNKGKCLCGNYYKANGRIFRSHGNGRAFGDKEFLHVAGNSPDFIYKGKVPTRRAQKRARREMLNK